MTAQEAGMGGGGLSEESATARTIRLIREDERERCAKIAAGLRIIGAPPIGPLYGIGWNEACMQITAAIRAQDRGGEGGGR